MKKPNYRSTVRACYNGFLVQAIVVNLTPVFFIPLREQFGFGFGQLGLLVLVNFITQVFVDLVFSHSVDRYGYRPFLVMSHIFVVAGMVFFALSPAMMENPYIGFIAGTMVFSAGGGLLELLLSPTVNAIPSESKSSSMSLLHSFYAWGQAGVVILTTLLLFAMGRQSWQLIMILWTLPAVINVYLFSRVPFAPIVPEERREGLKRHIKNKFLVAAMFAIALGAASELVMSQWSSAFMEEVMLIPKALGDIGGMSMFAVMLGLGRLLHGKYGKTLDVRKLMIIGTAAAAICYLIVAVSPYDIISLAACAICGIAVSLLWPGTLVLASERFPFAGTWLFAFLAASGDIGASVGPWLMGVVSDNAVKISFISSISSGLGLDAAQAGMRTGMLLGSLLPLGAMVCFIYMRSKKDGST